MDSRLAKLIKRHEDQFNHWIETINENSNFWLDKEVSSEEGFRITHNTVSVLSKIASVFYQYGNFKEEFEDENYYPNLYGPELIIKAKKTKTIYNLGINDKGIYLSAYMMNVTYLKNMNDHFWRDILKLSNYENFELDGFNHIERELKNKYPELGYDSKGIIYNIFRKYFFRMTEYQGDVEDFGSWKIMWPYTKDFSAIIIEGCEVFKLFYKLNYELWKVGDLKQKNERKLRR